MKFIKPIIGNVYSRLTCLKFVRKSENGRRHYYLCKCSCGAEKEILRDDLVSGHTRSCGCLRKEVVSQDKTTHGLSTSPYYQLWGDIKKRCNNPNHKDYHSYGGRGIKVFSEWENDFLKFYNYIINTIGPRPSKRYSIDRIDNSLGYQPANVRWSLSGIQTYNRRYKRPKSGYRGVTIQRGRYVATIHKDKKAYVVGRFSTAAEASEAYKRAALKLYGYTIQDFYE